MILNQSRDKDTKSQIKETIVDHNLLMLSTHPLIIVISA